VPNYETKAFQVEIPLDVTVTIFEALVHYRDLLNLLLKGAIEKELPEEAVTINQTRENVTNAIDQYVAALGKDLGVEGYDEAQSIKEMRLGLKNKLPFVFPDEDNREEVN
jgi:hypothetical protein